MHSTKDSILTLFKNNCTKEGLLKYVKNNPESFEALIEISFEVDSKEAWKASWLIGHTMQNNDIRIQPKINNLIEILPNLQQGHQRQTIIILLKMYLNDDQEGKLFDLCLNIWENIKLIPSTRMTAMRYILSVVDKFPELKSEIKLWTQDMYLESLSPGIKHGLLKQIGKILQ